MQDDVDRFIAAWQRERPKADTGPLQLTTRIARMARHIDAARREALAARDLETWEFDVLAALRAAGAPYQLTPTQLQRAGQVASGTMTNRIDKLSRRGFVSREPDPADRRGVQVRLTAAGRRRVDAALPAVTAADAETIAELSTRKQTQLAGLLRELLAVQE